MMFFFVPPSGPDCEYDYDIRYWDYEEGVVLVVSFIPSEECDEDTVNEFVSMAADSIQISFEFGAKMFMPKNLEDLEDFIEHKELAITYFLMFPNMEKMKLYIAKMVSEEIF